MPDDLRRKILSKNAQEDSDDDDGEENDEDEMNRWGKKKSYWTGDTADLEIGQDVEEAEEEEEAAHVHLFLIL